MPARRPDHSDAVRHFGAVVKRVRLNSGYGVDEIAAVAGMLPPQWCKVENLPRKDISLRTFIRVARALGLSGTQLLAVLESHPSEMSSSGN